MRSRPGCSCPHKTVEANLSRVYGKLGIRSRAEIAHGLVSEAGRKPPEA